MFLDVGIDYTEFKQIQNLNGDFLIKISIRCAYLIGKVDKWSDIVKQQYRFVELLKFISNTYYSQKKFTNSSINK